MSNGTYFPKTWLGYIQHRRRLFREREPDPKRQPNLCRSVLDYVAAFFAPWSVNEYPGSSRMLAMCLGLRQTKGDLQRAREMRGGKYPIPLNRLRLLVAWLRARDMELGAILARAEAELAEREARPRKVRGFMVAKDWDGSGVIRTKAHWDKGTAERP